MYFIGIDSLRYQESPAATPAMATASAEPKELVVDEDVLDIVSN